MKVYYKVSRIRYNEENILKSLFEVIIYATFGETLTLQHFWISNSKSSND